MSSESMHVKTSPADQQAYTPSWQLVPPSVRLLQQHVWPVAYLSFLPALLLTVGFAMIFDGQSFTAGSRFSNGVIIILVAGVWSLLTRPGFLYLQTQAIKGHSPSTSEAFRAGLGLFLPFLVCNGISFMLIALGLLFFIVPGLVILGLILLAPYYVIDKGLGPVAAIKQCWRDSMPAARWIWGVIGVTFAFMMLATLFAPIPVIGRILSLAVSYLYIFAPALRYLEVVRAEKLSG